MTEREKMLVRCLLTLWFGWVGSIVINYTRLKPEGYSSNTLVGYVLLNIVTFGIYGLVASISNLFFDPEKGKTVGYIKD